jgi:hypothetical protein
MQNYKKKSNWVKRNQKKGHLTAAFFHLYRKDYSFTSSAGASTGASAGASAFGAAFLLLRRVLLALAADF